jgi:hypothetical protein
MGYTAFVAIVLSIVTFAIKHKREDQAQFALMPQDRRWMERTAEQSGSVSVGAQATNLSPIFWIPRMENRVELWTATGRKSLAIVSIEPPPGPRVRRLVLSSRSKTVELPPEDIEQDRPADLRSLMPEEFDDPPRKKAPSPIPGQP